MGNRRSFEEEIMANSSSSRWMPTAGGVLSMVVGVLGLTCSLVFGIIAAVFQANQNNPAFHVDDPEAIPVLIAVFWGVCAFLIIPGIISIVGGIFAIQCKRWGWALAGSICAVTFSSILGVLALVFIIMGKKEFSGQGDNAVDSAANC